MHDPFDETILPFDADATGGPQKGVATVLSEAPAFAYDGRGLTLEQFQEYVGTYDFGKVPPDYVTFHHTANPDASWAPLSPNPRTKWDRAEAGQGADAIRIKRKHQLDGIKNYYQNTLGWSAGPHLFIDDRFIWLFTPMYNVGIHAKWGNSFRQFRRLHYSIGIEVIGFYDHVRWPPAVSLLVHGAVQALQKRLNNFELKYLYPTLQSKPGMKIVKGQQVCAYPERLKSGGLTSHRDFNKPECPGAAITEDFYVGVCRG